MQKHCDRDQMESSDQIPFLSPYMSPVEAFVTGLKTFHWRMVQRIPATNQTAP